MEKWSDSFNNIMHFLNRVNKLRLETLESIFTLILSLDTRPAALYHQDKKKKVVVCKYVQNMVQGVYFLYISRYVKNN